MSMAAPSLRQPDREPPEVRAARRWLAKVFTDRDLEGAACATEDPDMFWTDDYDRRTTVMPDSVLDAKAVCARCPVRKPCLLISIQRGYIGKATGVWGGTTGQEREAQVVKVGNRWQPATERSIETLSSIHAEQVILSRKVSKRQAMEWGLSR